MGKAKKRSHSPSRSDDYEWEVKETHRNVDCFRDSQTQDQESKSRDDALFAAMLDRVASSKGDLKATSSIKRPPSGWKKTEPINLDDPNIAKRFINGPPHNLEMAQPSHGSEHSTGAVEENLVEVSTNCRKEVEERYVTDDDINAISAQILKAELMGNKEKVAKLKPKLDKLREARRRNIKVRLTKNITTSSMEAKSAQNVAQLTVITDLGRDIPLYIKPPRDSGRKHEKVNYHDDQGCRTKYLPDDAENGTVEDLIIQEKMEAKNFCDKQFVSLAGKCKGGVSDEYDDAFTCKRVKSQDVVRKRMKSDAIADYKRREYAESSCSSCMSQVPRYLIMSIGESVFLSLPEHASLTQGHCILAPLEHVGAMTRTDENAVQESYSFKRDLCKMAELWQGEGASYVFVEIGGYPNTYKHHCQIECFPVDRETMEELPSYYKKALLDLGSEWDQNRRIVSLKQPGLGAHNAIPPNFGYIAVEFGVDGGGYAKVVEDWSSFPLYFGREVLAGILGKSLERWRKPKKDSLEELRKKAVEFEEKWSVVKKNVREHDSGLSGSEISGINIEGPELPPSML
ncbi:hypothetical protein Aperf_G00000024437 [Anoplocephala perfoliata]